MSLKDRLNRAQAVIGIVGALAGSGGDPTVKNTGPSLAKRQADYTKEVRLPQTRRDTDRILREATRTKNDALKNTHLLDKKDRKKLD
ncbi:hypothetical protein [Rhodococcus sp. BS-15]|uniref:hypothetical protein n=1 Tax=Rhodococcus sp. BS-15 TaxID=1304954 RepID=UPI000A6E87A8|nr:hypothetical protein [Rhodococcus sp. BS-15]